MAKLKNTEIETNVDVWSLRHLVATILPKLKWRRHGIGVLQGYVAEGPSRELRVHIWSRSLMLDGISESGSAHNHRFLMRSTVLAGRLLHTEYQLDPCNDGDHELWTFVHARLHNEENRTEMVRTGERCMVHKVPQEIAAGSRYVFDRFAFHSSEPISDVVVTIVEKDQQVEEQAKVVAPLDLPPVPAFSGPQLSALELTVMLEYARDALAGEV